jgi:hypothetical protein
MEMSGGLHGHSMQAFLQQAVEFEHDFGALQQFPEVKHVGQGEHKATLRSRRHQDGYICYPGGILGHRHDINSIQVLLQRQEIVHLKRRAPAGKFHDKAVLPVALVYSTVGCAKDFNKGILG